MRPVIQILLVLLAAVAGCLPETNAHQSGDAATASEDALTLLSAQSQTSDVGFQDSDDEQSSKRTVTTRHVRTNDRVSSISSNEDIHTSQRNDDRLITPMDQKENLRDLGITAEIRKRIIGTAGLSINARNVKVITSDGKVTLLGRVNSDEEHSIILRIATGIADSVDDRIQVNTGQNSDKRVADEKKDG